MPSRMIVHELEELLDVLFREAQHAADDARRDVLRVLRARVDHVLAGQAVEQFRTELSDHRLQRVDGAGAKAGRISRRAIAWNGGSDVMGGATPIGAGQVQFRRATVTDDDGATREVIGVLGDLRDAGVRRGEPGAAVAIGVGDRAALTQVLPDRIGVGDPLRIGVIEVGGEVLDERAVGHDYSSMKIACSGQFAWASRASSRCLARQRAVADDDAVAEIVEVEDRRRDGETSPLTLTDLGVNSYFHGSPFSLLGLTLLPSKRQEV